VAQHHNECLQIFSGTHSVDLAEAVANQLDVQSQVPVTRFAGGEIKCKLPESIRGDDVYIFQSHGQYRDSSPNDALMEQLIMIDAAKRASAGQITAVAPYLGYGRQDRKASGREPITARMVADMYKAAGAQRIISVDLHSGQGQGFFDGPFDHLIAMPVLLDYVRNNVEPDEEFVVASADIGRAKAVRHYIDELPGAKLTIVDKEREKEGNDVINHGIIGANPDGLRAFLVDDMIDGAGTICSAAKTLRNFGATAVTVVATHGLFSPPAAERLQKSAIDEIVITDTLPPTLEIGQPELRVVSIASMVAHAIHAIHEGQSVSALFDGRNQA
jgi:ribose-phosphate pyrophosphokinase